MFYSSYSNIEHNKQRCPNKKLIISTKNEIKKNVLKLINIFSSKNNIEKDDVQNVKRIMLNKINTDFLIYNNSKKQDYNKNLLINSTNSDVLKVEINRLIHNIKNKSNFLVNPKLMTKESEVVIQNKDEEKNISYDINEIIKLTKKVVKQHNLNDEEKMVLIESNIIRLQLIYSKYNQSNKTKQDLNNLNTQIKLIKGSIINGLVLEYGYFMPWINGYEQLASCLIQPSRFDIPLFKIKRKDNKLYYLLPKYDNFKKCVYAEDIIDKDNIDEQVNITLIKIANLNPKKSAYYNCDDYEESAIKDEEDDEETVILDKYSKYEDHQNVETFDQVKNNKIIFYTATGSISYI